MENCEIEYLFAGKDESITVSMRELPELPECFEETSLGDPKGSEKQFRCLHGYHARMYPEFYEIHRDKFDPRLNPVQHLLFDTDFPRVALGLLAVLAVKSLFE
jgi:hypothetical protein